MMHSKLLSPAASTSWSLTVPATPAVPAPILACASPFQQALHDINNLLLIMSSYTAFAVDASSIDSPAYAHLRLAQEAVSQAALFAHELRTSLK